MTIYYLCSAKRDHVSGGVQKLFDHVALLGQMGFDAEMLHNEDILAGKQFTPDDMVVIPEVFGDGIRDFLPASAQRRVVFVQNSYLTEEVNGTTIVHDPDRHPYYTTPQLEAILTESQHTEDRLRARFPNLTVPLIRTHSSGNGRFGKDAGFSYGPWPREKRIVFFGYKHEIVNDKVFSDLDLPDGWTVESMTGMTDAQIQERMRTSAIFAAANTHEGMCAPTSEAMISGAVIVCWTGGGPDEYLADRAVIAEQDDVEGLRFCIEQTARHIDLQPDLWAARTREWSDWFQATYSRQGEIDELRAIWESFGYRAKGPRLNLGCGTHYATGWTNLDARETDDTHPDIVVDPADPFTRWAPGTVERVYLGHLLEHIPWADVPRLLAQVRAALRPDGELLVVSPDCYRTLERWKNGLEPWELLVATFEGDHHDLPATDPGTHKWNCFEARVQGALERAGFVDVHPTTGFDGWPVTAWSDWQCAVIGRNP